MKLRYLHVSALFAVILLTLASGCKRNERSTLQQFDRELQALAKALSPSIIELIVEPDSGLATDVAGSALAIDQAGQLLTTATLLNSGKPLLAKLSDGSTTRVTLIGTDYATNLALLELDSGKVDSPVPLIGPNDVNTGQMGILVGTVPMMLGTMATIGMLGHTDLAGDDPYDHQLYAFSSTSMFARPGAPVFDANGGLVGLIDGKLHDAVSGSWTIIPLATIKKVLPMLEKGGGVPRGFLGIKPSTERREGVVVDSVYCGSPAANAGIQKGDCIIEANGVVTKHVTSLRMVITRAPGKKIKLTINRNGVSHELEVTLTSRVLTTNDRIRHPLRRL